MTKSHGGPFRGFRDHEESPFFCAADLTPEETWERSIDRLADLLVRLGPLVAVGPIEMSVERLCGWHAEIFGSLFPDDVGHIRERRLGDWDHVYFGGHVGSTLTRRVRQYRGTHPRRLRPRLEKICAEFNATAVSIRESASTDAFDSIYVATRLYVKLLRAHPWIDGNLRTAFVALNAALLTLNLPRIEFKDLDTHDVLLGAAFVGRHRPYRALAEHIREIIEKAESA